MLYMKWVKVKLNSGFGEGLDVAKKCYYGLPAH